MFLLLHGIGRLIERPLNLWLMLLKSLLGLIFDDLKNFFSLWVLKRARKLEYN